MKNILFSVILLFFRLYLFASPERDSLTVDSGYFQGYLICVASTKDVFNNGRIIDRPTGYYILNGTHPVSKKAVFNEDSLLKMARACDTIFLLCQGQEYIDLNNLYFEGLLPYVKYPLKLSPSRRKFSKTTKKDTYLVYYIQAQTFNIMLKKSMLFHIIDVPKYHFSNDNITLITIRKIDKYQFIQEF